MARLTKAYERALRKEYSKVPKLGEGKRFAFIAKQAAKRGVKNPEAVAAAAMWKKYGRKGGAKLIKKGKK